jgi:hypothetical protein
VIRHVLWEVDFCGKTWHAIGKHAQAFSCVLVLPQTFGRRPCLLAPQMHPPTVKHSMCMPLRACVLRALHFICRAGQNHIYTVCIRYFWQGNHQIHGHIRSIYAVLANPIHLIFPVATLPPSSLRRLTYTPAISARTPFSIT